MARTTGTENSYPLARDSECRRKEREQYRAHPCTRAYSKCHTALLIRCHPLSPLSRRAESVSPVIVSGIRAHLSQRFLAAATTAATTATIAATIAATTTTTITRATTAATTTAAEIKFTWHFTSPPFAWIVAQWNQRTQRDDSRFPQPACDVPVHIHRSRTIADSANRRPV